MGRLMAPSLPLDRWGDVRSGDAIPASVTAANTPGIRPHESTLSSLTPPSPPASIVASLLADVATALASLHTDRADLMTDLATSLSDAASARADLLTDASTAQADHFAELASLLSSTAAAVALDRAALENSLESARVPEVATLQELSAAVNRLFQSLAEQLEAARNRDDDAHANAVASQAQLLASTLTEVTARHQAAAAAAAAMITAKGNWRQQIEEQQIQRVLAFSGDDGFEFDISYGWISEQLAHGNTELAVFAAFVASVETHNRIFGGPLTPSPVSLMRGAVDTYQRGGTIWNNARDADATWYEAVYQTGGVLIADQVGVTNVFMAATGEDPISLRELSTAERILAGTVGTVQLVGTATGLKAGFTGLRARFKKCGCFVGDTRVQTFENTGTSGVWLLGAAGVIVAGGAALMVEERRRVRAQQAVEAQSPWELSPDPDELDHLWMMPSAGGGRRADDSSELDVLCDLLFNASLRKGGSHVE